ncbi:MAG: hypothetical protein CV087_09800 [Candidatus Brocadia sp. WS118]|nr:MAG: hypothetical protein CV087_09800 [Candidatus Brocadia sp. WS118]
MNHKEDLQKIAYEAHFNLLQHYSSLVFKARISIITVSLLIFAYIFGFGFLEKDASTSPKSEYFKIMVAYTASIFTIIFFRMETLYIKRIVQVILTARAIEKENQLSYFFSAWDSPHYRTVSLFYFAAILGFIGVFWVLLLQKTQLLWIVILAIFISAIPFFLSYRVMRKHPHIVYENMLKSDDQESISNKIEQKL